jgi:hypothetical protein
MSDAGLAAYSCAGTSPDSVVVGGLALFYGAKPGYVQRSGQIPFDTKPGTVIHFTAEASGSRYTSGPGTACSNDLTSIEFDVTVR